MVFPFVSIQQDFDQNKLEEEMRKRKERVEKWREEQRKKAIENIGEIKKELEEMKQGKKWSLEDDDGEELIVNPFSNNFIYMCSAYSYRQKCNVL